MLPKIYTNLGIDYDERVLPSITNEVLKAIVVSLLFIFHPTCFIPYTAIVIDSLFCASD